MKAKEIIRDTLDIDNGLFPTFLALFNDPKKVVTHPELYTKPWKYATYVVSISCLLTWFFIHLIVDPAEQHPFWDVPNRILELSTGYAKFYENTQPLKRLFIHGIGLYILLGLVFYQQRKSIPLNAVSLYIIGQSVFLQFIFQAIGIIILKKGMLSESNAMPTIGLAIHIFYLLYALTRIYGDNGIRKLLVPMVIAVELFAYGFISTRMQHFVYYSLLNRDKMYFPIVNKTVPGMTEASIASLSSDRFGSVQPIGKTIQDSITKRLPSDSRPHEISRMVVFDSLLLIMDCSMPAGNEVAKITIQCYSLPGYLLRWSTMIFEKVNRYSPKTVETFLMADPSSSSVLTGYRLPNDSTSKIYFARLDLRSGELIYSTSLDSQGDDIHIYATAMDAQFVYVCGSVHDILNNLELGVVLKVDKANGKSAEDYYLGEDSFSSFTSFMGIQVSPDKIEILVKHDDKKLFLFRTSGYSVLTIPKN